MDGWLDGRIVNNIYIYNRWMVGEKDKKYLKNRWMVGWIERIDGWLDG